MVPTQEMNPAAAVNVVSLFWYLSSNSSIVMNDERCLSFCQTQVPRNRGQDKHIIQWLHYGVCVCVCVCGSGIWQEVWWGGTSPLSGWHSAGTVTDCLWHILTPAICQTHLGHL